MSCRWSGASGHRIVCQVVDMPISRLDYHILTPALLLPTATTGIPRLSLTPCVWERFLLRYALTRAKRQQQQQQQQQLGLSDSIRARWALLIGSRLSAAVIARAFSVWKRARQCVYPSVVVFVRLGELANLVMVDDPRWAADAAVREHFLYWLLSPFDLCWSLVPRNWYKWRFIMELGCKISRCEDTRECF